MKTKKSAYHECGHLIFTLIFSDCFSTESITLTPQLYSSIDTSDWLAASHIKPIKERAERNGDFLNRLNIILLAGVCAEHIGDKTADEIASTLSN